MRDVRVASWSGVGGVRRDTAKAFTNVPQSVLLMYDRITWKITFSRQPLGFPDDITFEHLVLTFAFAVEIINNILFKPNQDLKMFKILKMAFFSPFAFLVFLFYQMVAFFRLKSGHHLNIVSD
jgi:hypothetical protein